MKDELVLVVRRALLEQLGAFQGLAFDVERYLPALLARENNFFMPRSRAETDPTHKQIIPYVLLTCAGRVLHYTRGRKAGEQRLVALGSIGIGGHMNDGDEHLFALDRDAYNAGVEREVHEELILETGYRNRIVALLNDDSNEVGQVHLGVVHVFELESPDVRKREAMIVAPEFLDPAALAARRASMETWSQICCDALERLLAPGGPASRPGHPRDV
jgi:predicted NUDIX family phosphoesterase